jgi:NAD(P)H-flavin reductase
MGPNQYRVEKVHRETRDTFTLRMRPVNGQQIGPFQPGQFNMLYAFGIGEIPVSISGDPDQPGLSHTTRMVGAVSRAIAGAKAGDILGVRGPYGNHWPVEEAVGQDIVIVAGGIGLAPLRPAIYQVLANREKYGKFVILYGTRNPEELLFIRELERWRSRMDVEVGVTVDVGMGGWRGNVGVVTTLIPRAAFDPMNTVAFVCGPEVMFRFTAAALTDRGVDKDRIYTSLERNMKCALGLCGHCQIGSAFVCKDGPVFRYDRVQEWLTKGEI